MRFSNATRRLAATVAMVALATPIAVQAAPTPSFWDIANLVPGNPVTASHPWEVLEATGATCGTAGPLLTANYTGGGGAWVGKRKLLPPNLPLVYRAVSSTTSANQGITMSAGSIAMHPGQGPSRCAMIRFKAPADGVYKIGGEFFAPVASQANHPNFVNTRVLDKGTQVPVGGAGVVDKPNAIQMWSWPNTHQFQLQAGQTIDFAVDGGSNGIASDTVQLVGRVTWTGPLGVKLDKIALGHSFSCGIDSSNSNGQGAGRVFCWGSGQAGQWGEYIGGGNSSNKAIPILDGVAPGTTNDVKADLIAASGRNMCLHKVGDPLTTIHCFGLNGTNTPPGTLWASAANPTIPGSTTVVFPNPVVVPGGVSSIDMGSEHSCFVKLGNVSCWGLNHGSMFNPPAHSLYGKNFIAATPFSSAAPVHINPSLPALNGSTKVSAGGSFTCAIVNSGGGQPNGRIRCFGNSHQGKLGGPSSGLGNATTSTTIGFVQKQGGGDLIAATKIEAGGQGACAIAGAVAQVFCWGRAHIAGRAVTPDTGPPHNAPGTSTGNWAEPQATPIPGMLQVTKIALGTVNACALKSSGTVWCWGEVGLMNVPGATYSAPSTVWNPLQVPGLTNVTELKSDYAHFCAIKADKTVWCWGQGTAGQLGNNLGTTSNLPVQVIM